MHRKSSSDHGLARTQNLESVGVLIVEAPLLEHGPNLLGGKFPRPFEEVVRHLGSAVGKTIKWLLRRVIHQILFREAQQLRLCRPRCNERNDTYRKSCLDAQAAEKANDSAFHGTSNVASILICGRHVHS